jgi:pantothenate kinase
LAQEELIHIKREKIEKKFIIVGIGGCTNSGKSTLSKNVQQSSLKAKIVQTDKYWIVRIIYYLPPCFFFFFFFFY